MTAKDSNHDEMMQDTIIEDEIGMFNEWLRGKGEGGPIVQCWLGLLLPQSCWRDVNGLVIASLGRHMNQDVF